MDQRGGHGEAVEDRLHRDALGHVEGQLLPLAPVADAIALVSLFALARVFISLAAMDIGTAFGTLGARREMMIGFLAEPALLMVLFTASLISMGVPQRRSVSPGHLLVASIPIFDP